jgi:hypothetical protein
LGWSDKEAHEILNLADFFQRKLPVITDLGAAGKFFFQMRTFQFIFSLEKKYRKNRLVTMEKTTRFWKALMFIT